MKGVIMRAATIAMLILLLPAALFAGPTMGVYFSFVPGAMTYNPMPYEQFNGYLYVHNTACYLNAVEYAVQLPPGIILMSYTLPTAYVELGAPLTGHAIAIWPPMDGWNPGYNLINTFKFMAIDWCWNYGGTMHDALLRVIPNPESGATQYSCFPENYLYPYDGLTSIFCPEVYGVEETNWGAIKSLF